MKKVIYILLLSSISCFAFADNNTPTAPNANSVFMYGKVTTIDGTSYTGQLRWGKRAAFWFDTFNSMKLSNENLQYLSQTELEELVTQAQLAHKVSTSVGYLPNKPYKKDYKHIFTCHFGNLKAIEVEGPRHAKLFFKDGHTLPVGAGSEEKGEWSSVGAKVQIYDATVGHITMKWAQIKRIEFLETPKELDSIYGEPLYGTVQTCQGEFTGFIQWDKDERLSKDKLDGSNEDGEISIAFGNIASIEKARSGSEVILRSGRSFHLQGTNDVNSMNNGIVVTVPGKGRISIPWDAFDAIHFHAITHNDGDSYTNYNAPSSIQGKVETKSGKSFAGKIVYDLDEEFTMEILHGDKQDLLYTIPFSNIRRILPENNNSAQVELKDGDFITLLDGQDVSYKNNGLLIFTEQSNPTFVPWNEIVSIEIK